jgi:hypothetical protein
MKTKTFFLVCLFIGIGITQLSAQGTRTYPTIWHVENNTFEISIICGGEEVDILNFPASYDVLFKDHFNNDEWIWFSGVLNNTQYTSKITGEVFKAKDFESQHGDGKYLWIMNLNGNMGNHYNVKIVFDTTTGEIIYNHSVCH